jgi:hypothetical protein
LIPEHFRVPPGTIGFIDQGTINKTVAGTQTIATTSFEDAPTGTLEITASTLSFRCVREWDQSGLDRGAARDRGDASSNSRRSGPAERKST